MRPYRMFFTFLIVATTTFTLYVFISLRLYNESGCPPPDVDPTIKKVLLITTFRSGSTFFGEILQSHPDSFYFFEPLNEFEFDGRTIATGDDVPSTIVVRFLRDILDCNLLPWAKHFEKLLKWKRMNNAYPVVAERLCSLNSTEPQSDCYDLREAADICSRSKLRVAKVTRTTMRQSGLPLLRDVPNLKIIYLIRDPRGVFNSRYDAEIYKWCSEADICYSLDVHCGLLAADLRTGKIAQTYYDDRFALVKYEELSCRPEFTAYLVFLFLGYSGLAESTREYLLASTTSNNISEKEKQLNMRYGYTTTRVSTQVPFAWKNNLSRDNITEIESFCVDVFTGMYSKFSEIPRYNCDCTGVIEVNPSCYPTGEETPKTIVQLVKT